MSTILRLLKLLPSMILAILFVGCVTIKMGPKDPEKSKDLKYSEPKSPFEKLAVNTADASWKNSKSGNIISLFSECLAGNEASLESLQSDAARALDEVKAEKEEKLEYNDRAALRTLYVGKVDGIPMKMDVITFKKNSCSYIISLMGRKDRIEKDLANFDGFLKEVRAP